MKLDHLVPFDRLSSGKVVKQLMTQSELPPPILQNSVESDHGCTLRIYFDNAGDNVIIYVIQRDADVRETSLTQSQV